MNSELPAQSKHSHHFSIELASPDGRREPGTVTIQELNRLEKLRRSLEVGSVFLTLALLSIFIPFMNVILVPLLLAVAIGTSLLAYRESERITESAGTCPACQVVIEDFEVPRFWQKKMICPECRVSLGIERTSVLITDWGINEAIQEEYDYSPEILENDEKQRPMKDYGT